MNHAAGVDCSGGLSFVTSHVWLSTKAAWYTEIFSQTTTKVKLNSSRSKGKNQICHVIFLQSERFFRRKPALIL